MVRIRAYSPDMTVTILNIGDRYWYESDIMENNFVGYFTIAEGCGNLPFEVLKIALASSDTLLVENKWCFTIEKVRMPFVMACVTFFYGIIESLVRNIDHVSAIDRQFLK